MFDLIKKRKGLSFGFFAAAAASLVPWTAFLAEMLGPEAVCGLILMLLFLVGGFGILKGFWGSRFWAFLGPFLTCLLFAIILIGLLLESAELPSWDLILMLGLPLSFGTICLAIAVAYGAEHVDTL